MLDPFFGCGTVGLVCQRLNRQIIGIELNPEYVDQAMELLQRKSPGQTTTERGLRYELNHDTHQLTLLEAASDRRVLS